ncbi:MAG: hypothetical protein PHV97_01650, partial [Candidatus Omnitrophica bacterium]|nr:hypothetical protein [Candidatus Omnitrophota bacterium]
MEKAKRCFCLVVPVVFLLCLAHPAMAAKGRGAFRGSSFKAQGSLAQVPSAVGKQSPGGGSYVVPGAKAERTVDGKYYLDFKAAPLINVLNVLSNLSGINFVAGTEVAERPVNMTLDNVGLEDVLQAIAYGCNVNYDFLPGRNIYLFRA